MAPIHAKPGTGDAGLTGERRHLTVLFSDLVGSTAIAAQLDPEQWRETVAGYHRAAAEAIVRFGGYVAKYLGDGVMAYFGWPAAHDNDAERAARAGLAILDAIAKLNQQPGHAKLSARVGIDSGTVVIAKGASKAQPRSPTRRIGWCRVCS
ncbi:MAG: adenylate/guanylate cyclase domain-containing protein [Candidatus Binataceae bacterium]